MNADKSYEELMMRALVTAGLVSTMVPDEVESIKEGRGMFDLEMPNGGLVDSRWMFPVSIYKGLAHVAARKAVGEGLTSEELEELNHVQAVWKSMSAAFTNGDDFDSWLDAFGKDQLPDGMV
jgi:hypothetical protein